MSIKKFSIIALIVSAVLAGGISLFASGNPDGLEKVAADHGLDTTAVEAANSGSIFADYGISGIDGILSGSLAGLVGVLVTGLAGAGLYFWMRKPTK